MANREIRTSPTRTLLATPVFDTYWRFAAERQNIFMRRLAGECPPWTLDAVLHQHRFTNAYRASDRVSQYLIRHVIYGLDQNRDSHDIIFRTLLFKIFNKIETWENLCTYLCDLSGLSFLFHPEAYVRVLDRAYEQTSIYSAAYIMPSPALGRARKHQNHLALLAFMFDQTDTILRLHAARSLADLYHALRDVPSFGDFLAFQFAIDINYGPQFCFSEDDFVVAGPGARSGLAKCFANAYAFDASDIIRDVAAMADREFDRLGLDFRTLWGRPLQLIDCQNLFCEVDKYARVVHPEMPSRRTRIKQKFHARAEPLAPQFYPPAWGLDPPQTSAVREWWTQYAAAGPARMGVRVGAGAVAFGGLSTVQRTHE